MIDLVKYYKNNYEKMNNEYYKNLYPIEHVDGFDLTVIDFADLLEKWRICLYPGDSTNPEEVAIFCLASFYLYSNGYIVENHPNLLSKIKEPSYFSNGDLKSATRNNFGANGSMNGVSWADRRRYVDELKLIKKYDDEIPLLESVDEIFEVISTRNASFSEMSNDEKLMNIRNAFENIGKKDGKYLKIPFESLSLGYIESEDVKKFADELQCFRHGDPNLIQNRNNYSDREKEFMIDYGKMILNITSKYIEDTEKQILKVNTNML